MAFVQSIRKSFSRKRRRDVDPPSAGDEGAATGSHNDIAEASARTQRSGDSISCVVTLLDDTTASFDMEVSTCTTSIHQSRSLHCQICWKSQRSQKSPVVSCWYRCMIIEPRYLCNHVNF